MGGFLKTNQQDMAISATLIKTGGWVVILVGILANPLVLGRFFAGDGKVDALFSIIAILVFDASLIFSGILLLVSAPRRRELAFGIVAFILAIMVIEVGLHLIRFATRLGKSPDAAMDRRLLSSPYVGKAWAKELLKEHAEITMSFEPYLNWDVGNFDGQHTHVDNHGVRKSWNPDFGIDGDAKPKSVYVFGGSTLWGTGARDEHTIPSYISKKLFERHYAFTVSNYGEGGYNFTQEVLHLMLLLRDGYRPDYVIFIDGINDVFGAEIHAKPGALFYESKIKRKFSRIEPTDWEHLMIGISGFVQKKSLICESLSRLLDLFKAKGDMRHPDSPLSKLTGSDLYSFSQAICDFYEKSHRLLDNLSRSYGFKYLTFWQPVIYTEASLTDEESRMMGKDFRETPRAKIHHHVRRILGVKRLTNFFDISNVLSDRTKTYYLDDWHLSEEGNEKLANKIVDVLARRL